MNSARRMRWRPASVWAAAALIAVAAPWVHHDARAAFGAFYLGHDRQGTEFRIYLDGGEFLGRQGDFHAIRVTVHLLRKGRVAKTVAGCVYRFDEARRERDRLECSDSAAAPLNGVAYARPARSAADARTDALESLVCVSRCGPAVPRRLQIEGADEDNG